MVHSRDKQGECRSGSSKNKAHANLLERPCELNKFVVTFVCDGDEEHEAGEENPRDGHKDRES